MSDFDHARRVMVDNQLRTSSIVDRRILGAMGRVPRERFVPATRTSFAYIDDAQSLEPFGAKGRELPAPVPFARLVQLAALTPEDKVLVVGSGPGYSLAVISELAGEVVGVEPVVALVEHARAALADLGIANVSIVEGALSAGAEQGAPYDAIIVEGAVDKVPETLFWQLREGGRLVAIVNDGQTSVARYYVKTAGSIASRSEFDARMPALPVHARPVEFVF